MFQRLHIKATDGTAGLCVKTFYRKEDGSFDMTTPDATHMVSNGTPTNMPFQPDIRYLIEALPGK